MSVDDGMVTYHIWTSNIRSEDGPLGGGEAASISMDT